MELYKAGKSQMKTIQKWIDESKNSQPKHLGLAIFIILTTTSLP